ncbi:hypothetical protein ACFP2T_41420 [Plantactinospora solaniradicis]|uniref:Uncharacterized protein n=1 Tax=Plantactinospora solaniradicis TaxID=1723736 RepID=A0ABW1KMT6_9ACTN
MTRKWWRGFGRGVLLFLAIPLAANLLVVIVAVPSALLGPAVGIPVSIGALVLVGYPIRSVRHRRDPAARERWARKLAERQRRRRRRSVRTLRRLRRREPSRVTYREAAAECGILGFLIAMGGVAPLLSSSPPARS